ncbi:MAG: enoyl-CoA hydratase [Alteromonadaceae bacterium]|uniref:enoyl-CoA hydratase/isomerase family protein n=1 Tax=Paraglaciecola chathamensis TaxID=368405 RepID=UPI000C480881|nr:enoyl-CoA hydratase/isomerase family protein [Paraglaciecola agarilytica]MBN25591.1 enoyl-CoA hydratase [Alteromonadaceae bacterium]
MSDSVIFQERTTTSGMRIGHASLNRPSAHNALNMDMIQLLMPQLLTWQQDPEICMVILDGSGDKALCAGGDVVAMHNAMADEPKSTPASLQAFFTQEYQLDYLIHTYAKPFAVWGAGIVMGGGMGLMNGGSHRIVTDSSRLAMPEISIGLYPDVGGSWFLNNMPPGCGLFLGMTGASMNAADALYVNMADYFMPNDMKAQWLEGLEQLPWGNDSAANVDQLSVMCAHLHQQHQALLPVSKVQPLQGSLAQLESKKTAAEVAEQILQLDAGDDRWLAKAQKTLQAGSPISANLVFEQLQRGQSMTLAQCFAMELIMSCRCGEFGEFQEGVRALLVDKDHQPKWHYASIAQVPKETMVWFFDSQWQGTEHPLSHLDKE